MTNARKLRHLLGRVRGIGRRHAAAALAILLLLAGVWTATAAGRPGVALCLLATLVAATLVALGLLWRRIGRLRADWGSARDLRTVVDQTQRRVVAAVERERLAAEDRHREMTDALARVQRIADRGARTVQVAVPREVEATMQLFQGFTPRAPMPSSGDYALNPTDLLELLFLIRTRRPALVVELGSGTSSVWIAYVLEQIGGRLVSIEHDAEYAGRTRAALAAHGLTGVAEVREAPLTPIQVEDRTFSWYDTAALADLADVDFLLVDGPPAATGPDSRYPALHVLHEKLAARATIVFDDANRPDEQAAITRWTSTIDGLSREGELLGRHAVLAYARALQPTS